MTFCAPFRMCHGDESEPQANGELYKTPESAEVLGDHTTGWFGEVGYKDIMEVANVPRKTSFKFEEMFVCDPSAKYYGYKSWDGNTYPLSLFRFYPLTPLKLTKFPRILHPALPRVRPTRRISRRRQRRRKCVRVEALQPRARCQAARPLLGQGPALLRH